MNTGEKPFQCSSCNKTFTDNSNLLKHMTTHSGEQPFQCSFCYKPFSHKIDLLKHVKVHTIVKQINSSSCDQNFSNSKELLNNVSTHTGEKRLQYNQCGMATHTLANSCKGGNSDMDIIPTTNFYRDKINKSLLRLELPVECGRVVTTKGSCFYDSVLANLEEPEIRQDIAFRARNIREIKELRLSLAHFMENNNKLHECEQFQVQRGNTLENQKLTWTEYLAKIRQTDAWADELVVICMAIFLGKDIMQVSDKAVKIKPWCQIPGQIVGWPFSVTTPPLMIGNVNPWHFEPLRYKPSVTRETSCIGCGWIGMCLNSHLMSTTNAFCFLFS